MAARSVIVFALLALIASTYAGTVATGSVHTADPAIWLADLNAASDGEFATVIMSCRLFIPDVIEVPSGQTMHFAWIDACNEAGHTVTSSGTTTDPAQDLDKPQPAFPANCFDSSLEPIGNIIGPANPEYFVTLLYAGVVVREITDALPWIEVPPFIPPDDTKPFCLTDASFVIPDDLTATGDYRAIVPYFCRLHGRIEDPAGAGMRGAIVLRM